MTTNAEGRSTGLKLDDCDIYGTLPSKLGNLTELATLEIHGNSKLTGTNPIDNRQPRPTPTSPATTSNTSQPPQAQPPYAPTTAPAPGLWSQPSAPATPIPDPDPPSTPAAPSAVDSEEQIALAWTPPSDDGGTPITDYDIRYRVSNPGGAWCAWDEHTHNGTRTTNTITGLANGTAYEVQIRANNAAGQSP